jgi:hypothetical protein
VGFEPTIPAFERAKTVHTLDRAATVIGIKLPTKWKIFCVQWICRSEYIFLYTHAGRFHVTGTSFIHIYTAAFSSPHLYKRHILGYLGQCLRVYRIFWSNYFACCFIVKCHRLRAFWVRVRVILPLAVYCQSVRLGANPLEDHYQRFFLQLNPCGNSPYVTSSLMRGWVCLLWICLAFVKCTSIFFRTV